jgi:hypothetical protein
MQDLMFLCIGIIFICITVVAVAMTIFVLKELIKGMMKNEKRRNKQ